MASSLMLVVLAIRRVGLCTYIDGTVWNSKRVGILEWMLAFLWPM
jgi:hypothetical protein